MHIDKLNRNISTGSACKRLQENLTIANDSECLVIVFTNNKKHILSQYIYKSEIEGCSKIDGAKNF